MEKPALAESIYPFLDAGLRGIRSDISVGVEDVGETAVSVCRGMQKERTRRNRRRNPLWPGLAGQVIAASLSLRQADT